LARSTTSGEGDESYFEIGNGKDIEISEASEPTDIIWENRQATKWYRTKAVITQWVVMFFCITLSFGLIFVSQNYANTLLNIYPKVNCPEMLSYTTSEDLRTNAIQEFNIN